MKKVAVITFHRHNNYGAVLQCYALQQALKKLGYIPSVIDYRCRVDESPLSLEAIKKRGFRKCIISILGKISRIPRYYAFYIFRKRLNMTEKLYKHELYKISDCFDCYLAGSDNIWNAQITGLDSAYFLDFVENRRKRNTYAASFGSDQIPEELADTYNRHLSGIHTFLMREKSGVGLVAKICGKKGQQVLDPTLLLNSEEWNQLIEPEAVKERYVLAYQLVPSKLFLQKADRIAKQLNCKLVMVPFAQGMFIKCQNKPGMGPVEWLSAIRNAEYIVTDSFHGCVFSIIFHKPFNVVVSQLGTRIYSLLDMFDLQDKIIKQGMEHIDMCDIDYNKVDRILEREREISLQYLRDIIENV